jgi:ribosomal protein L14
MIQLLTKVNIIDNSGGLRGRCIKILKPHNRDTAKIGDIILVSILEITNKINSGSSPVKGRGSSSQGGGEGVAKQNKITKGSIYKALVVRTKINNPSGKYGGKTVS